MSLILSITSIILPLLFLVWAYKGLKKDKIRLSEKKKEWNDFVDTIPFDKREEYGFKKVD